MSKVTFRYIMSTNSKLVGYSRYGYSTHKEKNKMASGKWTNFSVIKSGGGLSQEWIVDKKG